MRLFGAAILLGAALTFAGCADTSKAGSGGAAYVSISGEEALEKMKADEGYIILDVRSQSEFDSGHIPEAICIPVETIGSKAPEGLPDKEQTIYVYCRSGNRSRQASEKLSALGYTGIVEIGGISAWPGDVVREG